MRPVGHVQRAGGPRAPVAVRAICAAGECGQGCVHRTGAGLKPGVLCGCALCPPVAMCERGSGALPGQAKQGLAQSRSAPQLVRDGMRTGICAQTRNYGFECRPRYTCRPQRRGAGGGRRNGSGVRRARVRNSVSPRAIHATPLPPYLCVSIH
jgi:hypothetical protein